MAWVLNGQLGTFTARSNCDFDLQLISPFLTQGYCSLLVAAHDYQVFALMGVGMEGGNVVPDANSLTGCCPALPLASCAIGEVGITCACPLCRL